MHSLTSSHEIHPPSTDASGAVVCKNCGNRFTGRFCNHCGQRADTRRITWHFIWHEIPHSIWHVDHGMLFTLKELFTRPGHTIREFLEGQRIKHYRPLALVLILGAVLTFLLHSLDVSLIGEANKAMREATGSTDVGAGAGISGANERAGSDGDPGGLFCVYDLGVCSTL